MTDCGCKEKMAEKAIQDAYDEGHRAGHRQAKRDARRIIRKFVTELCGVFHIGPGLMSMQELAEIAGETAEAGSDE